MQNIKAIFVGLTTVSICMAAISGKIIDPSGNPISGAAVLIEKVNESAVTGADGSFTLNYTGVNRQAKRITLADHSISLNGNLLKLNTAKKTGIHIAISDLSGKTISTVNETFLAGTHLITLPKTGSGVYIYRISTDTKTFLLKSTTTGSITLNADFADNKCLQNTNSTKTAIANQVINDVISITKSGYLNQRVILTNSDTAGIEIRMIVCAGAVTDIDGNVYQTVKIGSQEWMSENLRVTKFTDGTSISFDSSQTSWADTLNVIPKYCYYKNMTSTVEIKRFGALYNWYVVNPENPKKIAPDGWHVPTRADWDTLQNYLIANGHNYDGSTTGNKIAKAMAAKAGWVLPVPGDGWIGDDLTKNNSSGFSAYPGGYRTELGYYGTMEENFNNCSWWGADESIAITSGLRDMSCSFSIGSSDLSIIENWRIKYYGFSVRLVKDN